MNWLLKKNKRTLLDIWVILQMPLPFKMIATKWVDPFIEVSHLVDYQAMCRCIHVDAEQHLEEKLMP